MKIRIILLFSLSWISSLVFEMVWFRSWHDVLFNFFGWKHDRELRSWDYWFVFDVFVSSVFSAEEFLVPYFLGPWFHRLGAVTSVFSCTISSVSSSTVPSVSFSTSSVSSVSSSSSSSTVSSISSSSTVSSVSSSSSSVSSVPISSSTVSSVSSSSSSVSSVPSSSSTVSSVASSSSSSTVSSVSSSSFSNVPLLSPSSSSSSTVSSVSSSSSSVSSSFFWFHFFAFQIFRIPGFRYLVKLGTTPHSIFLRFPAQARHLIPGFFCFFLFFFFFSSFFFAFQVFGIPRFRHLAKLGLRFRVSSSFSSSSPPFPKWELSWVGGVSPAIKVWKLHQKWGDFEWERERENWELKLRWFREKIVQEMGLLTPFNFKFTN